MGAAEILAMAASFSLLAGWRLYATVLAAGLAMRFDILPLPQHLSSLQIFENSWILGVAAIAMVAEFLADKIAWVDSAWDGVHSLIRPIGGALLALAIVDPSQPVWQIVTLLLGGGSALLSHGAKASARAAVNASPEPVSNVVVSGVEDITTTSALVIALANPWIALVVVAALLLAMVGIVLAFRRFIRDVGTIFTPKRDSPP